MSEWINFAELRKQLNFAVVLESYGITLTRKGTTDQYTGPCPLPNHGEKKGTPFSANFAQGLFRCFGCKESGNIIDFAVLMAKADKRDGKSVRKIAGQLRDKFVEKGKPEPEAPKPAAPAAHTNPNQKRVVNEPLNFSLKTLEPNHPFFEDHKLTAETVAHFGLGFCKRGSLAGRIAVPLVDDVQQLVGYSGLVVDEKQVSATSPRYLYPAPREVDDVLHRAKTSPLSLRFIPCFRDSTSIERRRLRSRSFPSTCHEDCGFVAGSSAATFPVPATIPAHQARRLLRRHQASCFPRPPWSSRFCRQPQRRGEAAE